MINCLLDFYLLFTILFILIYLIYLNLYFLLLYLFYYYYFIVPEDQIIRTNQTNILIRSLMLMKQRGDSTPRVSVGSRKRYWILLLWVNSAGWFLPQVLSLFQLLVLMFHYVVTLRAAEKAVDGKAAGKRAMTTNALVTFQGDMFIICCSIYSLNT